MSFLNPINFYLPLHYNSYYFNFQASLIFTGKSSLTLAESQVFQYSFAMAQIENCIVFDDISFTYPVVEGDFDAEGKQIIPSPVFDHFSGAIPGGFTSLVGPNGCGKSTFLLLASGRLVPQNGKCLLMGKDVASLPEEEKNLLASVIYQNMEFESEDTVKSLLTYVFENGALKGKGKGVRSSGSLLDETIKEFQLTDLLERGLNQLSKGEIQRVLLAFSLLYGSKTIFMDEPLFAMEEGQKESALEYLSLYSSKTWTSIYISMHELELSRKYAQNVILFYPNRDMDLGSPDEILTNEALEKAYGVPAAMLKDKESMTRDSLIQTADTVLQVQRTTK